MKQTMLLSMALFVVCCLVELSPLAAQSFLAKHQPQDTKNCKTVYEALYKRQMANPRPYLPYDFIHEKDVFWEKRVWREVDFREKMNHSFTAAEMPFVQILLEGIKQGDIQAYNPVDDAFEEPMSSKELMDLVQSKDTVVIIDPETYEERITVVENDFNPEDVVKLRIKEVWFFDEETSTLQVRILGIAPVIRRYDENGDFLNEGPMFWAYYPHLRPVLSNFSIVNNHNDQHFQSWDDLFEMRYFSSYITKASNVHDRRIKDYAEGVAALLEGEKIRDEIFNFEHDLWSY